MSELETRIRALISDETLAELEPEILVFAGPSGAVPMRLRGDNAVGKATLIGEVRGGKHAELEVTATTFRQKDGVPNRRHLRFNSDGLGALAASFVRMPVLRDHNTYSQASRIGTITASELAVHGGGWSSFRQTLRIVKPEAVIGVLDGTLDRFSIGWNKLGPVMCTAHKVDVTKRGSCSCWPGDVVVIDGVSHTVEFEFQKAEGIEVSAVNVPAVRGTQIHDVRAALAAELGILEPRTPQPPTPPPRREPAPMKPAPTTTARTLNHSERVAAHQLGISEEDWVASRAMYEDQDAPAFVAPRAATPAPTIKPAVAKPALAAPEDEDEDEADPVLAAAIISTNRQLGLNDDGTEIEEAR